VNGLSQLKQSPERRRSAISSAVRRLNERGGAGGVDDVVVVKVGVDRGAFRGSTRYTSLVDGALLESASTARRRSYAQAKDMAISMSVEF